MFILHCLFFLDRDKLGLFLRVLLTCGYSLFIFDGASLRRQVHHALHRLKLPTDSRSRDALFRTADTNNDGFISSQEFRTFYVTRLKELRDLFDELDQDKSGRLNVDDVFHGLPRVAENTSDTSPSKLTRALAKDLLERVDRDGNGLIDFEEWCEFLVLLPGASLGDIFEQWQKAVALDTSGVADTGAAALAVPGTNRERSVKYLIAGGVAGAVSRTATAPLDRVKILLQTSRVSGQEFSGVRQGLAKIYTDGGMRAYWRGNGMNVLKIIPESSVRFLAYEFLKRSLNGSSSEPSAGAKLLAGGLAGVTSQIAIYPMEVIRTRLAVASPGTYRGMFDAFTSTFREGGVRSLYRGLTPSVAGIFPFAAIDMATFDVLKTAYRRQQGHDAPTPVLLACGAISGSCGQAVSYPLDLVRRRLQMQGMPASSTVVGSVGPAGAMPGPTEILRTLYLEGGVRAWYRGMGANLLKVVPAVSCSYAIYEQMKRQLGV